jgi:4-hydroxybenzoyl-CoA thioesterase
LSDERDAFRYVHRVRFDEVDAAGIAYFARFFSWCHDAMASMLGQLEGGYRGLLAERRLGLPAVHVEADFASPLRFDDEVHITTVVERLGASSAAFLFRLDRTADGARVATIRHIHVLTDLASLRAVPLTDELRAVLGRHMSGGTS